jgi:hypothetical protein
MKMAILRSCCRKRKEQKIRRRTTKRLKKQRRKEKENYVSFSTSKTKGTLQRHLQTTSC